MGGLLEGDEANLRAPLDMLGTVLADESSQGVKAAEALIAGGCDTATLRLQIGEELPDQIRREIGDRQPVDRFLPMIADVGQKQRQHVAIASLGVDRKVALLHQILKQETPYPRAEQCMVSHDHSP